MLNRWGYKLHTEDATSCVRCSFSTYNPPCMSCGVFLCELCFQFSAPCCDNMKHEDGRVPDMMHGNSKSVGVSASNPHLKTIQCVDVGCLTATKVSVYEDRPTTIVDYRYCPKCGGDATIEDYYTQEQFYQMLSTRLRFPIEIIREIYPLWNKKEYGRFRSFVRNYIKELLQDG